MSQSNLVKSLTMAAHNAEAPVGKFFGVVVGVITNNKDPDGKGRVKVKYPWLSEEDESYWARLAVPMAGSEMGVFFLPEVDDEVLVAFEHGNIHHPYVIGALWNGQQKPPQTNDDGKNNVRMIKSRSGHIIKFNDEDGSETLEIIDSSESNSIVIDVSSNKVTITSAGDIALSASDGKVVIDAQELSVTTSGAASIEASGEMTLKGSTINLN